MTKKIPAGRAGSTRTTSENLSGPVNPTDNQELKGDCARTWMRVNQGLVVLVIYSLACIVFLGVPDIQLITNDFDYQIPFLETHVSYGGFLFAGPLFLILVLAFLHYYIGRLCLQDTESNRFTLPFWVNKDDLLSKLTSTFLVYWLAPCVLAGFVWKAVVRPGGYYLISVAAIVSLCLLYLKNRRTEWDGQGLRVGLFTWIMSTALVVVVVVQLLPVFGVTSLASLFTRSFDFSGTTSLSGKNLSKTVLVNANFELADLRGVDLSKSDLRGSNFSGAILENANMAAANLVNADFSDANLKTVFLDYSMLGGVTLNENSILSSKWRYVWEVINDPWDYKKLDALGKLNPKPDFRNVNFTNVNLSYLDLSGADFSGSNFAGVNLEGVNLEGAILRGVRNLKKVDSVKGALVKNIVDAPAYFRDWAVKHGARMTLEKNNYGDTGHDLLASGGAGPDMVVIGPGRFLMGTYTGEDDVSILSREKTIRVSFAIGVREVSVGDFKKFITATNYITEAEQHHSCKSLNGSHWRADHEGRSWRNPGFRQTDTHPVVCVSWNDAQEYISWIKKETGEDYRLPSETEWEYVAREGGNTGQYWKFGSSDACQYANVYDKTTASKITFTWEPYDCDDLHVWTAPSGSFLPNRFGVYDMLGNVWEWVQNCYEEIKPTYVIELIADSCEKRVFRGGSWHYGPGDIYAGLRAGIAVEKSGDLDGFRLARSMNRSSFDVIK